MNNKYALKMLPKAREDLESIVKYIHTDLSNPKAAQDLLEKASKAFNRITEFPNSCPMCKTEKAYRKLLIDNYIVFYKTDDENNLVVIYRILYGMMDYDKYI